MLRGDACLWQALLANYNYQLNEKLTRSRRGRGGRCSLVHWLLLDLLQKRRRDRQANRLRLH